MDHPSFNFQRWRAGTSENALRPTIGALSYEARHANELARVSWYLMVPPVIPPTREVNKSARLKEWTLRRVRSRSDIGGETSRPLRDATSRPHLTSDLGSGCGSDSNMIEEEIPWQKSAVRTAVSNPSKSVEDRTAPQFHSGLTRTHPVADADGRAGGISTRSLKRPGNGHAAPLTVIVRANPSNLCPLPKGKGRTRARESGHSLHLNYGSCLLQKRYLRRGR